MTKARARQRAKAKAAQKASKKAPSADPASPEQQPGKFDHGQGAIKGPQQSASIKNFAGARSGSARSR